MRSAARAPPWITLNLQGIHLRNPSDLSKRLGPPLIAWEYEKEGYNVNETYYLPDFFLPEQAAFFEVKGTNDYDEDLLQSFSDLTRKRVILAVGNIPEVHDLNFKEKWGGFQVFFPCDAPADDFAVASGSNDVFLCCDGCRRIQLMNASYATLKDGCCEGERLMPLGFAFEAARSARFEHGQSG